MSNWHTEGDGRLLLIMDDKRVVGSIVKSGDVWSVEIPMMVGDDIRGEFDFQLTALAFVSGVEQTIKTTTQ